MLDLISIGNISIDLFFKGNSLTYYDGRFQLAVGGKYEADRFYQSIGGGGANVAIGSAKHGLRTAVWGMIGDNPFKKVILEELDEANVSTRYIEIVQGVNNVSSILLSPKGERTIIHYSPQNTQLKKYRPSLHELLKAKMVYMGNLAHSSFEDKLELASYLGDLKEKNIFILNLGITDCRRQKEQTDRLLKHADIVLLNGHEFSELVRAQYEDIHFHEHVIQWYLPKLTHKLFVITEGKKGSFAYCKNEVFHVRNVPVEIVDTTGAGDAYTAGFISSWYRYRDIEKAMHSGSRYASRILQTVGAN